MYVGRALPSTKKGGENPSLASFDGVWETAYMAEGGRTELQNILADAISRGDQTRDYYDNQLRKMLGTTGKPLWDVERGKVRNPSPRVLRAMEEVLGFPSDYLVNIVHPRPHARIEPDRPPVKTADGGETAPVLRLDLSYSMGPGTNLDDSYIESEAIEFDIGFLRTITITPPDRIRIVDGIGDSMTPTLHDRDLLFVDINQRDLNAQDRIWAVWIYGLGAVKRLRAIGPDRVLVISDNPDMPDQEVKREDIVIHGRVVGSIKRH